MKLTIRRALLWGLLMLLALFAIGLALNWNMIQRTMLGGVKVYESIPPELPSDIVRMMNAHIEVGVIANARGQLHGDFARWIEHRLHRRTARRIR